MPITLFPFNGGINSHIDRRLLPDGALADATNVELDRQGRLSGRAKFTAQAMTAYTSGTLVAYDLFSLNDRLFAIGETAGNGFPGDIFEYLPSGLAKQWRPSAPDALTTRLPRATRVRDIARPPDQEGGSGSIGCAAFGGFVCLVWNNADDTAPGYVHVVTAANDQTILFSRFNSGSVPRGLLRVVALSDRFIILGAAPTSDIHCSRFIPASDTAVTVVTTSLFSGVIVTYAACKVQGSDEFCVVVNIGGTVTLKRFNNVGVDQVPSGGAYGAIVAAATALAVEGSATANEITVAMVVGGEAQLYTFNLTTGAELHAGAHVPFPGETSVEISVTRQAAAGIDSTVVSSVTSETAPTIFSARYRASLNTILGVTRLVTDATLTSSAFVSKDQIFCGVREGLGTVGNTPNMLVSSKESTFTTAPVTPQIVKDLEVASTTSVLLPDIALDASTGKYYWANANANPDGDAGPMVTEFEISSTSRRQTAQYGNTFYIAGGAPLAFDGETIVESGFLERPRIISLTPSNGAGELLGGGTYRYRCHWEWLDSKGDLHLSPPSAITSVDLSSSHDTVTAVVTSPHSLRCNSTGTSAAKGDVVRCVLSRTLATVSTTPATLLGSEVLTPPSSSLNGLTLKLFVFDGSITSYTVTFSAAAITAAVVASEVQAVTSAKITASVDGDQLRLTTVVEGESTILAVLNTGTANAIIGFPASPSASAFDRGETDRTVGENFQRAATAYTALGAAVAAYVTVTDLRKDQSDPTVDSDLIRQQVLYSQGTASGAHHAPPPSECLWAGRERLIASKQAKRSRYTASKLIVPAEPAEFATEGLLAFSGSVAGDIEASAMLGDTMVHWTRRQIWFVTGQGPDRSGQGTFFAAQLISKTMGLASPDGWRSLCEDDAGIWFQGSDKEIYRLSKGGAVEWLGKEVQDKLLLFPIVTAAIYVPSKSEVAFAVTSTDGLTGGILRYREERQAWFFDDVGVVTSMADYQGRIAIVQAGVVLIQDTAPGVGTAVPYNAVTGMFQGFQGLGYGALQQVGVLGTYRGPFTLEILKSIDGTTFPTSLGSWVVTGADYAVGDRVTKLVTPAVMQHDQFALKYVVTPTADSEGLWLHAAAIETEKQPGFVRAGAAHNL